MHLTHPYRHDHCHPVVWCRHPVATLRGFANLKCDQYHPKKHDSLYSADYGGRMGQSGSIMVLVSPAELEKTEKLSCYNTQVIIGVKIATIATKRRWFGA